MTTAPRLLLCLCTLISIARIRASQECTIASLCKMYEIQRDKLLPDLSIFDLDSEEIPVLLFSPRLYAGREMSEQLAQDLFKSVNRFLECIRIETMELIFFPFKQLYDHYQWYPEVFMSNDTFSSFEDMMERVECHARLLHHDPVDYYFAIKLRPDQVITFMRITRNVYVYDGFLAAMALLFDNVDSNYVNFMLQYGRVHKAEKDFACTSNGRDEKWKIFLSTISKSYLDILSGSDSGWTLSTLRVLLSQGHSKMLAHYLRINDGRVSVEKLMTAICRTTFVPVVLNEFRIPIRYKATNGDKIEGSPIGLLFSVPDLFEQIFMHCANLDFIHAFTVFPSLCRPIRDHIYGRKIHLIEQACHANSSYAVRFINDVNLVISLGSECLRLGSPWFLSGRRDILSVFVDVLIAQPRMWSDKDLFEDYIRDFPLLSTESAFKYMMYCQWPALISKVIDEHDFTSSAQFETFIRRALHVTGVVISMKYFPKLPSASHLLTSLELLLSDENVKQRLHFHDHVVFEIMQLSEIEHPVRLLNRLLPSDTQDHTRHSREFIMRALCQHHFGDLRMPLTSLAAIIEKTSSDFTLEDLNNGDFLLSKLNNDKYVIGLTTDKEDVKYVIEAVLNGKVDIANVSTSCIDACFAYICDFKFSVDEFRQFVEVATRGGYKLAAVRTELLLWAVCK